MPDLVHAAEELYARSIVIDMISTEYMDDEGLSHVKESGVTCFSPTVGTRSSVQASQAEAAISGCVTWHEFIAENESVLAAVLSTADIYRTKKDRKSAVMLNFQNTPIEDRLENLDMFDGLGVRYMQLTYNERNLLGDGCTERTNTGLSDFGVAAVERMNELGILVDTSHSGYRTTLDAIEFSKLPPIFSHTNCAALNEHPRNKSDEQIRALADKGGVVGLTTANNLVKKGLPVTMEHFLDHLDYIVNLVGVDHVAFGSDSVMRGWPTDAESEKAFWAAYGSDRYKSSYRFRYPLATEGINNASK